MMAWALKYRFMVVVETLIVLSILIIVHELGHFLAAKLFGVEVLTFSLGFGPKVIKKRLWNTDFAVSLIPFGGYVQMAGSEPRDDGVYETHEFLGRSRFERSIIVTAGPIFNLFFGFVIFFVAYSGFGVTVPRGNVVGKVEKGSIAEEMGLKEGDRIIEVDGSPFKSWYHLDILLSKKRDHFLKVLRGNDTLVFSWAKEDTLPLGIVAWLPPTVGRVLKGSPAEKTGLIPGDVVKRIDGRDINSWEDLVKIVRAHPRETLSIQWQRGDSTIEGVIVPQEIEEKSADSTVKVGKIGISAPMVKVKLSVGEAFSISREKTWFYTKMTVVLLFNLITGKVSLRTIGGPVMIGKLVGETSSYGIASLLILMGLISINLFIINLFPFPVLDGGHLFLFSIEAIRKKPLSKKFQELFQQVGFVVLIMLMLLITFMDILRLTGH